MTGTSYLFFNRSEEIYCDRFRNVVFKIRKTNTRNCQYLISVEWCGHFYTAEVKFSACAWAAKYISLYFRKYNSDEADIVFFIEPKKAR
jgi:hypothetical protein